ncbi:MAG TPA: hypothetical protein VJT75_15860 [Thermoleophilaceae bacterium]|nr:hypothetical protein [Thermoleophilaceae bacterium]
MTRGRSSAAAALAATLASAACAASAAGFGFAPARTAAGPGPDVVGFGGVSLARDGGGAVAYLLRDTGQPHVYVSRLRRGDPTSRVRVDTGQLTPSSDVRVAAADRGRIVVTWMNAGQVWGAVERRRGAGFEAPRSLCVCPSATDPSLDVTRFGTAYLTFATGGTGAHDVRVAVYDEGAWTLLSTPVDIDPARDAFGARVAASSDGTGVAAWTERVGNLTRVYERRLLRTRLSQVPQQASLGSYSGRVGGPADTPAVDVTDESSFVWVAFRQSFGAGGSRVLARRLRGSAFDRTGEIDGQGFPAKGAVRPLVAVSGRGYGMALTVLGSNALLGAPLRRLPLSSELAFEPPVEVGGRSTMPPRPAVSIAESTHALAVRQRPIGGTPAAVARYYGGDTFGDEQRISPPGAGPLVGEFGIDAEGDDADDHVVAFLQGPPEARRVQVVAFAGELEIGPIYGHRRWRRTKRPLVRWRKVPTPVPWGPVRYRLTVAGRTIGTTRKVQLRPGGALPEGANQAWVTAIDARGSQTRGKTYIVGVDTKRPHGRFKHPDQDVYRVWASDGRDGSGIREARLDFGGRGSVEVPIDDYRVDGARVHVPSGHGPPTLMLRDWANWTREVR